MDGTALLIAAALLTSLVAVGVVTIPFIRERPQRGVLLLAAAVPYDGLLVLFPHPGLLDGWKEALLLVTLAFSLLKGAGQPRWARTPQWLPPVLGMLALGLLSAALVGGVAAALGLKIGFFYLLIPLVLYLCPFSSQDRDRLVTILMVNAFITAVYGLVQQVLGENRLRELGYEYEVSLRTTGGILRTFSTFSQPFPFGLFLMMVLLIGCAVALAEPRRWRNLLFLLSTPLLVVSMASSIVRGAYLGLALGIIFLGFFRYRWLLFTPLLGVAALMALPEKLSDAIFSSSSLTERAGASTTGLQGGWTGIPNLVAERPWGWGLSTTGAAAEKLDELGPPVTLGYQPDNYYAKIVIELGVVGLWLLLLMFAGALAATLVAARRPETGAAMSTEMALTSRRDRSLALGVAASVVAAAGASVVSTYFEIFPMEVYFWLLLSAVACMEQVPRSRGAPQPAHRPDRRRVSHPSGHRE